MEYNGASAEIRKLAESYDQDLKLESMYIWRDKQWNLIEQWKLTVRQNAGACDYVYNIHVWIPIQG